MTDVFNSREIAVGIWVVLFLILACTKKDIRDQFSKLIASVKGIILTLIFFMVIYNVAVVWALETLGLWRITQLKDTILWFIFTGLAVAFQLINQNQGQSIKSVLKNNAKLIIFFEFVVNAYTFPLLIEIILFPMLVISGWLKGMSKYDSKYSSAEKFANWVLSLAGTGIIINLIINITYDHKNFMSFYTLHDILLPVILTILFLPFIYILMLYIAYEKLFSCLREYLKESNKLQKCIMKKIIIYCKLNLTKVKRVHRENGYQLFDAKSQEDVDRVIFEKSVTT